MSEENGSARLSGWAIRPGRHLLWAPAWDDSDAALVFDATSGDYWVLSLPAAGLLRALAGSDRLDEVQTVVAEPTAGDVELLAELQQHGLIASLG